MMTFLDLSVMAKGMISLLFMVSLILACTAVFRLVSQKNYAMAIPAVAVTVVAYIQVQLCGNITKEDAYFQAPHAPLLFERVSWTWLLWAALLLIVLDICFLLYADRWHQTHITAASLKEGMDDLPAGLCWYAEDGTPILRNRVMERLCVQITGHSLYDGLLLDAELRRRMNEHHVMTLDDGTVWSVVLHTLKNEDGILHEICAYDITEEYQVTHLLLEKQKEVQLAGENLVRYNRELAQMITAEEILAAKVRIHDELGQGLLLTRKYLLRGGTAEDRDKLLQVLRKNNSLMEHNRSESGKSYLDVILEAASDMGVRLVIDGAMPERQAISDVITTAIHENLTNTIRHAQGDELRVEIRNEHGFCTAVFTNSGRLPDGPVEERGGIATLRTLVESADGRMELEHTPRFKMTLRFVMEGEQHGTSADM